MMTQAEAQARFIPSLKADGQLYRKFLEVVARPAVAGEVVVTVTAAARETTNTAKDGDVVVRNLTGAGEEYILPGAKFSKLYEGMDGPAPDGYRRFKPLGQVVALTFHAGDFGLDRSFEFVASWGEPMACHDGDAIVMPPDGGEVYRIDAASFRETYEPV